MLGRLNKFHLNRLHSILVIIVAAFLVFGVAVRYGFLEHDDDQNISHNPRLQTITTDGLTAFWEGSYLGLYIPVTYTYWAAGVALSHIGEPDNEVPYARPWIFHFGNILLHAINACFIYILLRRFGAKDMAALVGAMVFLLHPMQVEAVAWVSGAKDLLSTFFALTSMICYSAFLGVGSPKGKGRYPRAVTYLGALLLFCLAILAKPSTVVVPAFLFMEDVFAARKVRWRAFLRVVPHLIAVGLLLVLSGASQTNEGPFPPVPYWLRPLVAGDSVLFYLRQLFIPLHFAIDYGRRPDLLLSDYVRLALATGPYILGAALLWQYHKGRFKVATAAYALFVVGLLPTLGFMQFAYAFFSLVCDRYAYLAMLGAAVLAASLFQAKEHRLKVGITACLLLFLAVQSALLTRTWEIEASLFGHSIEVEPEGSVALVALSNDRANKGFWRDTIPLLERASAALPVWGRPYNNLGTTYLNLGNNEEAVVKYRMALKYFPTYPLAHSNLCAALAGLGRYDEAEPECRAAIALAPEFDMPLLNLGFIYAKNGKMADAEQAFRSATALAPGSFKARRNLTIALKAQHKCDESISHLRLLNQDYPKDQGVALDFAACLQELGRQAEAEAVLQAFVAFNQGSSGADTVRSSLDQLRHK